MRRDGRFWRNVAIVAFAHITIAVTFVAWSRAARTMERPSIVWLSAGLTDVASKSSPARTESSPEALIPVKIHPSPSMRDEGEPSNTSPAKSDIQLPVPTHSPAPVKTPVPKPDTTPVPKAPPKKVATPTPKTTLKKTAAAKATPTPPPKSRVKAAEQEKKSDDKEKETAKVTPSAGGGSEQGKSGTAGSDGEARTSEFRWYGKMLYDRFNRDWVQPTTSVPAGAKMSALVKIRIERDGHISKFTIIRPSGNVAVDESVAAVAKRVTQVDPLPNGLSSGGPYEVNINFELNPTK